MKRNSKSLFKIFTNKNFNNFRNLSLMEKIVWTLQDFDINGLSITVQNVILKESEKILLREMVTSPENIQFYQ